MKAPLGFDTTLCVVLGLIYVGFLAALGGFVGALAAVGTIGLICAAALVTTLAEKAALQQRVNELVGLTGAMAGIIRESPDPSTRAAGRRLWDTHWDTLRGGGIDLG